MTKKFHSLANVKKELFFFLVYVVQDCKVFLNQTQKLVLFIGSLNRQTMMEMMFFVFLFTIDTSECFYKIDFAYI